MQAPRAHHGHETALPGVVKLPNGPKPCRPRLSSADMQEAKGGGVLKAPHGTLTNAAGPPFITRLREGQDVRSQAEGHSLENETSSQGQYC